MPSFRDFVAALNQLPKHREHARDASGATKALLLQGYRASPVLASELNLQPLDVDRGIVSSARQSLDGRDDPGRVQLALPLNVRPGVGARGLDLQLRLFHGTIGEPLEPSSEAWQRRRRRHEDIGNGLLGLADRTAGLLFARLLLPDATAPVLPLLAGAHCAAAALRLTTLLLRPDARRRAGERLRALRRSSPLLGAAAAGAERLGGAAARYGEPAGLLLLLAAAWVALHPTSAQLAEAVATLVPVLLGYSQTARHCARKQLPAADMEAAWHARHKWAARRCAHLLGDLPERPPLAGLVDAWQGLCLSIGATVNGQAFSGTSSGGGWTAGSEEAGWSAWGSASLGGSGGSGGNSREAGGEQWQQLQQPQEQEHLEQQPQTLHTQPASAQLPGTPGRRHPPGPLPGVLDSPSELCGPLPNLKRVRRNPWREHGLPEGEAAASGSGAAARQQDEGSDCIDFMHPSRWADARSQGGPAGRGGDGDSSSGGLPSFIRSDHSNSSCTGSEAGTEAAALLPAGHEAVAASPRAPLRPAAAAGLREVAAVAAAGGSEPAGALSPTSGAQSPLRVDPPGHAHVGGVGSAFGASASQEGGLPASGAEVVEEPYSELAAEDPPLASLYGRADHMLDAHPLTPAEVLGLLLRALHLGLLFAPFVLLGSSMLLLASQLSPSGGSAPGARSGGGGGDQTPSRAASAAAHLRRSAWHLLLWACRRGGAAMIKWGQWSSTREDVFPEDMCAVLSELHDRAPVHPLAATRAAIEAALGAPPEALFRSFEDEPLASGSVAQVHRATLLLDGREVSVAVKVRHPGVAHRIWQDFRLLRPLAALTAHVRSLRGLQLKESVMQFSHTMTAQADLRVEAAHLRRFHFNFRHLGDAIVVPRPVPGMQTEAVLVETFEPGRSVAHFIRQPRPCNTQIVAKGVDAYLKMLLADNFVHTDLHPGNILVRTPDDANPMAPLQIVLLDFGLAEELTPRVRCHFISFLNMIAKGDGRAAARHLLAWGRNQHCPDPEALAADIEVLFRELADVHAPGGIDLDRVFKATLRLARKHEVTVDSSFAALVIGICVIVGFATGLDPGVNLMDAATPCLLAYSLTGRVAGRLYN